MRSEKILLALVVLSITMSGFIVWYLFGSRTSETNQANIQELRAEQQEEPTNNLSQKSDRSIPPAPISTSKAISITNASQKGKVMYYDPETGVVTEVGFNGSDSEIISPTKLPGFIRTFWSPNKNEVISEFTSSRFRYFDYVTKRAVNLGTGIQSIAFSPTGSQIAYFLQGADGGGIYIATPDNQESKRILNTRFSRVTLSWPQDNLLSLVVHDEHTDLESIFLLTTDGKLTKIFDNLSFVETVWSRDGTNMLLSFFNENSALQLKNYSLVTGGEKDLGIEARASQCAWTAKTDIVFCGVSHSPLSRAAVENRSKIPQDMYEINTVSFEKKVLFSSGGRVPKLEVSEILLSPAEDYILFTNTFDQKLYSFKRL